jgi:hypothetical protein
MEPIQRVPKKNEKKRKEKKERTKKRKKRADHVMRALHKCGSGVLT